MIFFVYKFFDRLKQFVLHNNHIKCSMKISIIIPYFNEEDLEQIVNKV